ncbi:MAG: pilus assembly protein TadB, partial [Chloroflexi bacterium]|nr:pilus assembly protein TadB [Chloroflexota bacterium]
MSSAIVGGLLGLMFAGGVLLVVWAAPPMRPIRLVDRLAPYLGEAPAPSRLLQPPSATSAPFTVVRRLFGPTVSEIVSLVDRLVGGNSSVRRRLDAIGRPMTVEEFRFEQVVWAAVGMLSAGGLVLLLGVAR